MPIHEYECLGCGERFELLVRGSGATSCPRCQSHDLQRLWSAFAVKSDSTRKQALATTRKSKGSLNEVRERREAEHALLHHDEH
jgi:putative FmdB family regulatory protein